MVKFYFFLNILFYSKENYEKIFHIVFYLITILNFFFINEELNLPTLSNTFDF